MRGEELQLIGATEYEKESPVGFYVLPGTHSKWIKFDDGCLQNRGIIQHNFSAGFLVPEQVCFWKKFNRNLSVLISPVY